MDPVDPDPNPQHCDIIMVDVIRPLWRSSFNFIYLCSMCFTVMALVRKEILELREVKSSKLFVSKMRQIQGC